MKELLKRKSNEQSLGEIIQDYLRESGWQQKLDEMHAIFFRCGLMKYQHQALYQALVSMETASSHVKKLFPE